jgi:carboxylesterase
VIGAALVVATMVAAVAGRLHAWRVDRSIRSRHRVGPSGVIVGAEEFLLRGTGPAAVLLVHGGGDTPQTMKHLAAELHSRGYTVSAPLLPGHGRNLTEFGAHGSEEWYATVREQYASLGQAHEWVGVIGLSMGAALAARLAADIPETPALVMIAPFLTLPPLGDIAVKTSWIWSLFIPAFSTASDRSVLDPRARDESLGYGAFSATSLRAVGEAALRGREALPRVRAPTLIIQSTADNRVPTARSRQAFEQLGSKKKHFELIEGGGHVLTVDYGWERVVTLAADWMDSNRR